MPAGSDPVPALPALPARFRPFGVRIASVVFGAALLVIVVAVWLALPESAQESFTVSQRGTVAFMLFGAGVVAHAMSRCRVDADEAGLTVVNGYRTRHYDWDEVVGVTMRPGDPWAVLDLASGLGRSAMGIQGSDGARARRQVRELRALIDAHTTQQHH
jgi:Bacterial PH domain